MHTIRNLLSKIIEPSPNTTDPLDRHKQRLLNMLLVIFVPVSVIFAMIDNLRDFSETGYLLAPDTLMVVIGIIIVLGFIYFFSRRGKFNLLIPILMSVGFLIIYLNATITSTPHLEIAYLSLLIFLASDLFRPRITIGVALLTIVTLTIFYSQMQTMPSEVYSDLRLYFVILTIFTFFMSYHRDQLEKDRQQLIQRERIRLQLLLENIPAYVWTTNQRGVVTSISSTLSKQMEGQLRGFLKSDSAREYYQIASSESKSTFEFEMGNHTYEGIIQEIQSPIDEHVDYIGVAVDVNDRVEREKLRIQQARIEQQQQVLEDFLNSVSHDLRTPLSILRTSSYMLERLEEPAKRQAQIDKINRTTSRLETTIEHMFKLVRLNMPVNVAHEQVSLNEIVNNAILGLQGTIAEKPLELETCLVDSDLFVEASSTELLEMIQQVVQNAIQYSHEYGVIKILTYIREDFATIEVQDHGTGISDEDLPLVFDPFYRGERHRPLDTHSIGIGLTVAKRIAERHHGSIHINNQVDSGTIVIIKLPLAP